MFYAEQVSAPTRASSPRQLPTDHGHAVSTREYQSDQSSRKHLRCHRLSCSDKPLLRAHQQERVPATLPVDIGVNARTVLGCKGALRRGNNAAPLQPVRRSGSNQNVTGGSGRNTPGRARSKTAGRNPCGCNRPEFSYLYQHP